MADGVSRQAASDRSRSTFALELERRSSSVEEASIASSHTVSRTDPAHALSFTCAGLHRATRSQLVPTMLGQVSSSSPAQAPPARSQPCACRCHAHACTSRYPQLRRLERSEPPLACRARRLQLHPWLWYRGERRDDLQRSAATTARAGACVLRTRDMCERASRQPHVSAPAWLHSLGALHRRLL